MLLWWAIVIANFPAVKEKAYWRNKTCWTFFLNHHLPLSKTIWEMSRASLRASCVVLIYTSIYFCEYLYCIWVPGTNFFISPRPSNMLLAIPKNILDMEQWTNGNQEFILWTNRKQLKTAEKFRRKLQEIPFLPYVFTITAWKIAITTAHQRLRGKF